MFPSRHARSTLLHLQHHVTVVTPNTRGLWCLAFKILRPSLKVLSASFAEVPFASGCRLLASGSGIPLADSGRNAFGAACR